VTVPARSGPLLPADRRRDRPLFAVIAILAFLACLAGLAAAGAWRAAEAWTDDLGAEATVQVLPGEEEDPDALAARAAEALRALDTVEAAEPLGAEAAEALLAPWFGETLPQELPAPRLVAVSGTADAEALSRALEAEGIEAVVDDHGRWERDISRAVVAAALAALGALVLLAMAAAGVVVFATRAGLAARRAVLDALKIAGARDAFVARLFLRRFLMMGLKAGLAGALLAAAVTPGLYFAAIGGELLGDAPAPGVAEAAILAAAPLVAGALGAATAWIAVLAALRESG